MTRPNSIHRKSINSRHHGVPTGIQFVKETFSTQTVNALTNTITPANTIGNLLVANISARGATTPTISVGDTGGNTWTLGVAATTVGAGGAMSQYYSVTTAVSGTFTATSTVSGAIIISCLEFSAQATSPADVFKQTGYSTATIFATGTSASTAQAKEVVVAGTYENATGSWSAQTAGYTVLTKRTATGTLNTIQQSAYLILAAIGTQAYQATGSTNTTGAAVLGTYKGT